MNSRVMQLTPILLALIAPLSQAAQNDNVRLHGALVAEPCVIPPGDENIRLAFGSIIDKYLYTNQRTHGQAFEIHLTECDLSLGKTVKVTLRGIENPHLTGLLAIEGGARRRVLRLAWKPRAGSRYP